MVSSSIPADVLQEILYRLPLKSIARFRSVCKDWNSLLTHPQFTRTFRQLSGDQLFVFAFENLDKLTNIFNVKYENLIKNSEIETITFKYPHCKRRRTCDVVLFGSFNGLVATLIWGSEAKRLFICWNPLTKEQILVAPNNSFQIDRYFSEGFRLCGLCYNSCIDEYSIVLVVNYQSPPVSPASFDRSSTYETFDVSIVSLKTGRCTQLDSSAFKHRMIHDHCEKGVGTVVCGVPHWLIQFYDFETPLVQKEIFYFDQEEGTFSQMAGPRNYGAGEKHLLGLGALDGQKQLGIVLQRIDYGLELEVWVMKQYEKVESWTNMFTISTLNFSRSVRFVHLLGIMPKGELLINVYYDGEYWFERKEDLWVYDDTVNDHLRQVNFGPLMKEDCRFQLIAYEPSVTSPGQQPES